jgi:hypothetical protein
MCRWHATAATAQQDNNITLLLQRRLGMPLEQNLLDWLHCRPNGGCACAELWRQQALYHNAQQTHAYMVKVLAETQPVRKGNLLAHGK